MAKNGMNKIEDFMNTDELAKEVKNFTDSLGIDADMATIKKVAVPLVAVGGGLGVFAVVANVWWKIVAMTDPNCANLNTSDSQYSGVDKFGLPISPQERRLLSHMSATAKGTLSKSWVDEYWPELNTYIQMASVFGQTGPLADLVKQMAPGKAWDFDPFIV